jgi:uncharacterized membrane protein YsdA (DUF1294 family)
MPYVAPYLVLINLLGFALMGMDKRRARKAKRRIPEKSLFAAALLGGAGGSWLGMAAFRHKTRHPRFRWGLPAIFLLQAALLLFFSLR